MKIKIIKDSNPIMRKKSLPVDLPLSDEDRDILNSMTEYLKLSQDEKYAKAHNIRAGVGLAAIQIGLLKRMFVVYYPNGDGTFTNFQLVNPRIVETSIRKVALSSGEGCLSVDKDHKGLVHRYYKIKMKAFDAVSNSDIIISTNGYDAVVLQHEYDHLDGIFYYDRIDKNHPDSPVMNEEIL